MRTRPGRSPRAAAAETANGPQPARVLPEDRLAAMLNRWPAPRPPDAAFLLRLKRIPEAEAAAEAAPGTKENLWADLARWWHDAGLRPLLVGQAALILVALLAGLVIGSIERRPVITLDVTPLITADLPLTGSWPEGRI
ncbi:MAG: hypothetical protein D6740_05675 [Alphaproteobacteria bacterium]|nr:MAG: hypothetical protein D6740_05675 [Alphaproteobacteria bacterium]